MAASCLLTGSNHITFYFLHEAVNFLFMLLLQVLELLLIHRVPHAAQRGDIQVRRGVRHPLHEDGALPLQVVRLAAERLVLAVPLQSEANDRVALMSLHLAPLLYDVDCTHLNISCLNKVISDKYVQLLLTFVLTR